MKKTITINQPSAVRRVDDLGRIVIPREIRQTMCIQVGDPMDIFCSSDGIYLAPHKGEFVETHKQRCLVLSKEEFKKEIETAFKPFKLHHIEFDEKDTFPLRVFYETGKAKSPTDEVPQITVRETISSHFDYGYVNIITLHGDAVIITFTEH